MLILVLFRVLFLVSNEAKECSTPNSTPLVGVLFVVLHSNGVLFVVFSFKSFGVLKTVPFGVPFGVRQLFKLALRLALDTSLICRSLVLNGVLKAVPNGVLKGVLFAVLHSKHVLFVVHSFKSFGDWSAESSTKWSDKRSAESSTGSNWFHQLSNILM